MPSKLEEQLLQAVTENNAIAVEVLLDAGADPNAGLFREDTADALGIRNCTEEILSLLLQHAILSCLREEHESVQKEAPAQAFRLTRSLPLVIDHAKRTLITCAGYRFAHSLPPGHLQMIALYGAHYMWFIFTAFRAGLNHRGSTRRCYQNPELYAGILLYMSIPTRFENFKAKYILSALSIPIPSNYLWDLIIAWPLYFCIFAMGIITRNILSATGIRELAGISSSMKPLPHTVSKMWISPVVKAFTSILRSKNASENMVLTLLRADLSISHQVGRSRVARSLLLQVAIDRCWPELTAFLVDLGVCQESSRAIQGTLDKIVDVKLLPDDHRVSVDQASFSPASEMNWPALSQADACVALSVPQDLNESGPEKKKAVSLRLLEIQSVLDGNEGMFLHLVRSKLFQDLASQASGSKAVCHRMLKILESKGADPLLTNARGIDALSELARVQCSNGVFTHMTNIWKEARDRKAHSGDAPGIVSLALCISMDQMSPDLELVSILLDAGMCPHWENEAGETPLSAAAFMNEGTEAIALLLENGADPNNGGKRGKPPIFRTLDDASRDKFVFFLDHGASPNSTDHDGRSILQAVLELAPSLVVLKSQLVACLIDRGAIVYDTATSSSPIFLTALRQRTSQGHGDKILHTLLEHIPASQRQLVIKAGLRTAVCDQERGSLSSICTFNVFWLIRQVTDPTSIAPMSDQLLQMICSRGRQIDHEYTSDMQALLGWENLNVNSMDSEGCSPLHLAVKWQSRDFVLVLLQHGAEPNARDGKGRTPLQILCTTKPEKYSISHGPNEMKEDADDEAYGGVRGPAKRGFIWRRRMLDIKQSLEQEEIFQSLVQNGADMEVKDIQGSTLLMSACEQGNTVLVANIILLHCRGAPSINDLLCQTDGLRQTPLHFAAAGGCVRTMKVLLFPEEILHRELNPWREMAVQGEKLEVAKRSCEEIDGDSSVVAALRETLDYEETLASTPGFLRSGLVHFTSPDTVTLTIGDDSRKKFRNLCLPNVSVAQWKLPRREQQDAHGGETKAPFWNLGNRTDAKGWTPLHTAARNGHVEAVKCLLEYSGASVEMTDLKGRTAADLAQENNFWDVYSVLKSWDAGRSERRPVDLNRGNG